jgi:hypothetical protein
MYIRSLDEDLVHDVVRSQIPQRDLTDQHRHRPEQVHM